MNHSGDAAEQIVRLSLEGVEVAARITGAAAKEIAMFIIAALKSNNKKLKLKGKARMTSMLKSGKALEIFSVKDRDLKKFMQGAKQYGVVYCVLRSRKNTPDGLCDIMVKADDAPKISRLVERFQFATVDKAKIESEIIQSREEKAQGAEPESPDKNDTTKLLNDLLGTEDGKADAQPQPEAPDAAKATPAKDAPANPTKAKTEKSLPSEPTSESRNNSAKGTTNKPSVREELREIKATRAGLAAQQANKEAEAPARGDRQPGKPRGNSSTTHTQPPGGGKSKSTKSKSR